MSCKVIRWKWLTDISVQEQELINGGDKSQVTNNNFSQTNTKTTQNNNTGSLGNLSQSNTDFFDVNSSAQSLVLSDVIGVNNSDVMNPLIPPIPATTSA